MVKKGFDLLFQESTTIYTNLKYHLNTFNKIYCGKLHSWRVKQYSAIYVRKFKIYQKIENACRVEKTISLMAKNKLLDEVSESNNKVIRATEGNTNKISKAPSEEYENVIIEAYRHVVLWKKNLSSLSSNSAIKQFVDELTNLIDHWVPIVFQILPTSLLQKDLQIRLQTLSTKRICQED